MHLALYRKWRPMIFDDVVGQEHITEILRYEVSNNKASHAYLFCGSRGTGKTTCAKILAKAVNCKDPQNGNPCCKCENCRAIENGATTDVLEMDAASNTGVDYIRDIKDEVMYAPSMVKNRVYIIDEVHMLSDSAFNALLKTLEEPPSNVIFILATTERQKIPATILSRCQKFDFKRISSENISNRLKLIADNEGIKLENDAARFIAGLCNGGMRDSISMLELVCSDGNDQMVTVDKVAKIAGVIGRDICSQTVEAVLNKNTKQLFEIVGQIYYSSYDISAFWNELIRYYRDLLVVSVFANQKEDPSIELLDLTKGEYEKLKELTERLSYDTIMYQAGLLENAYITSIGKQGSDKRLSAELTLLRMAEPSTTLSLDSLATRLSTLEAKVASGGFTTKSSQSKQAESVQPKQIEEIKANGNNDKGEDSTPAPQAAHTAAASERIPVDGWDDILSQYRIVDSASAPYFDNAVVYIDHSSNLIIELKNDFSKMMVELAKADVAIYNLAMDKGLFIDRVKFTVKAPTAKTNDFDFEN